MIMQKIANMDLHYRAVQFYFDEQPMQVNALLSTIASKVDHGRMVSIARKAGQLPLILPYLKQVQQHNLPAVNEAVNEIYADGEMYDELRQSIDEYENFDQLALASKLEKHELVEMRRIATLVYKKNKRFKQSIDLSKLDSMHKDAMETARDSGSADLVEGLLRFFVEQGLKECFGACLYTCYDCISPDVALELAWRYGMLDFAMPYLIQAIREYTSRIDALDKKTQRKEEAEEKNKSASNDYVPEFMMPAMTAMGGVPGMSPNLAIMGAPMQQQPSFPQQGMMMQPGMVPQGMPQPMMPRI
jgi:clathrin heavy chain